MSIRINDVSVIDQFSDTIPRAAGYAELYLRLVAQGVQAAEPPVEMSLDEISSGGFRAELIQALVVTPTKPRLRWYRTCHYAKPSGGLLNVGWYLVGGERAGGRSLGIVNVGAATDIDADEIRSIVEVVQTYAVIPAIQQIADTALGAATGSQGFFGV